MRIKIVVVDADPWFRGLAKWALETALNVTVVGETAESEKAIRLTGVLRPDVVLMDIAICGREDAIRRIKAERPETRVVVLTSDEEAEDREAAGETGADAILSKERLMGQLVLASGGVSSRGRATGLAGPPRRALEGELPRSLMVRDRGPAPHD